MPLPERQFLYNILRNLWHKDVYIETDTLQCRGKLVYVGKFIQSGTARVSIQDVLHGKQMISLKTICQVWFRNKCLWRASP
jgi:hypothetical protein